MISEHTKLMNCFIGLTKKDFTFPSSLREEGYNLDSIEPHFRNSLGEEVNGDLLLNSRKIDHALVIECKGGRDANGGHLKEQIKKYKGLTKQDILPHVSTSESSKLSMDVTFVFSEKDNSSIPNYPDIGNNFAVIIKKESSIEKSNDYGSFKRNELNILFSRGISIPKEIPTKYYPFSCDDSLLAMAPFILRSIVHLARKKRQGFTEDDILDNAHPLWKYFDDHHKKSMRTKLDKIMKSPNFQKIKNHIVQTKTKWRVNTKSYQALQETCEKIKDEIQKDSEQSKITEY